MVYITVNLTGVIQRHSNVHRLIEYRLGSKVIEVDTCGPFRSTSICLYQGILPKQIIIAPFHFTKHASKSSQNI